MNTSSPQFFLLSLRLILLAIFSTGLHAQATQVPPTVGGKVIDAEGRPVPGATVALRDRRSDSRRSTVAAVDGSFEFNNLLPSLFTLTASQSGFADNHASIDLTNQSEVEVQITLVEDPDSLIRERIFVIGSPAGVGDVPGSAYFISTEELDELKTDFDDIHRFLRQVPGINIQEEEGFGLRPNIGMRGSGVERSAKITVMEDGVLIAPAPYSAPSAYYFPTTGRMESIEVRKGSSQVKYGPRTNGGTLNLISNSIPNTLRVHGAGSIGQDSLLKGQLTVGDSYEHFGWMAETYQFATDGFKDLDTGGSTGYRLEDYLGKFRFSTSADAPVYQEIEVKLGKTSQDADETYLGITDEDFDTTPFRRYAGSEFDNITTDHEVYQARHFLAFKRLDLTTVVYRNNFKRNWYKLQSIEGTNISDIFEDTGRYARELNIARGADSGADSLKVRANNRDYYSQGLQTVLGLKATTGQTRHQFEFGVRYHSDQEDRFQHEDGFQMRNERMSRTSTGAPGSQSNRIGDARAWAFFVQDEISWGRLTLTPGVRYENIDLVRTDYSTSDPDRSEGPTRVRENHVEVVIPGVGARYEFNENISFVGGVFRGFGPPGPGSNEFTDAEESVNYELGLRVRGEFAEIQATAFFNDYRNLLGIDTLSSGGTGEGDFFNGGEAFVHGLELSGSADLGAVTNSNFSIPLSFAYTGTSAVFDNTFLSDYQPWGSVQKGDSIPYIPSSQFHASLAFGRARWRLRADTTYVGRMRTQAGQGPIDPFQATDSYLTLALTGEYDFRQERSHSTLFVSVRNLTDEKYIVARRPAGARPGLPRTLMAGIRFSFGR